MKNVFGALLGVGAVAAVTETMAARYFFNRTMTRGGTEEARTMRMAGTDWEQYIPWIREKRHWLETQKREEVWITSEDGLRLHGTFFPAEGSKKTVLCFHGYTSEGVKDYAAISEFYLSLGFHMLIVDERAHGQSEGTYIGFGCLDRRDALLWMKYLDHRFQGKGETILHGISMGGATVLMASGLNLPESVKGIISDCGFTSPWEVFASVLRNTYKMPGFPILQIADQMVKSEAGYSLKECSAREEVKKARIPILFIHGNKDTFVPCWMCHELYSACLAPKGKLIVEGAGHAEAYYKNTEVYQHAVLAFLREKVGGNYENI